MYKAYLQSNDSSVKAIRKFHYQTDFNNFWHKIRTIFPELSGKQFTVSWKGNYYI